MSIFNTHSARSQDKRMKHYYQLHARIYDSTRWSFLFGRDSLLQMIPDSAAPSRILEVGCGTGYMLQQLCQQFPDVEITGMDISGDMLAVAEKKLSGTSNVSLKQHQYTPNNSLPETYDLILLSYSLTMMQAHPQKIIDRLTGNLIRGGLIAVVDFNTTPFSAFQHWMHLNHVQFSGDTLPYLKSCFTPISMQTKGAYFGLWNYYQFLGKKV